MIVVLACVILQCLKGNLRFMTLIESLQVNCAKTKVMIFKKRGCVRRAEHWTYRPGTRF